jgi:hypothetical protein
MALRSLGFPIGYRRVLGNERRGHRWARGRTDWLELRGSAVDHDRFFLEHFSQN